ncbi:aprataxin-like protein [Rhodotorula kratochvilovae]
MPPRARLPPLARPHAAPPPPIYDRTSLRARFLPFPLAPSGSPSSRPAMSWNAVLESYARLRRPERELPEGVWVANDERTLTIFDGYEKAKYHMLVLPRDPFPPAEDAGGTVPSRALTSLSSLLASPHALPVLQALRTAGEEVAEMIRDEMEKTEGWSWDVRMGFHAVESMRHWNSFHPTLGYFLHLEDVIGGVEEGGYELDPPKAYESLLSAPLTSHYPPYATFANLPKLKVHLQEEWEKAGRRARAGREEGDDSEGR